MISLIMHDTVDLFENLFPSTVEQPWMVENPPVLPEDAPAVVVAAHSGFVQYTTGLKSINTF